MALSVNIRKITGAWLLPPATDPAGRHVAYVTIGGERRVDELADRADAERVVRNVTRQRRDAAEIIRASRGGAKIPGAKTASTKTPAARTARRAA
jgi:hypothetical protein